VPAEPSQNANSWADAARDAAHTRGLSATDLQPLRVHGSGIFLIRPDDIVARVTPRTPTYEARARHATATTHALAATGFACTRPLWAEPTFLDTAVVTFWHYYPQPADDQPAHSPEHLAEALADLLRDLHTWTGPLPDLEPVQPLARLAAALQTDNARDTPALRPDERDYLTARVSDVQAGWEKIESALGWGLIHNDAHRRNLLLADTSPTTFVLADWDGVGLGPREIDLVQTGSPGWKFDLTEAERLAFTRRYGFDLADWPGHTVLREARLLHSLAAYIRLAPAKSAAATELHARLDDLLGRQPHTWRPVK
jgi:hypothetical protein